MNVTTLKIAQGKSQNVRLMDDRYTEPLVSLTIARSLLETTSARIYNFFRYLEPITSGNLGKDSQIRVRFIIVTWKTLIHGRHAF